MALKLDVKPKIFGLLLVIGDKLNKTFILGKEVAKFALTKIG